MKIQTLRPALATLIVLLAGCNFESFTDPGDGGPSDNALPVANAGEDRTVVDSDQNGNEPVAMDGSASKDPDGTIATHIWSTEGQFLAAGPNPTITMVPGEHIVTLTVTDNRGAAATDDVLVTVIPGTGNANIPPTANAGNDVTVSDNDGNGSEMVTLNGSGSSDPDGGITRWVWTEGGTQVALGEQAQASLGLGRHTVTLTVADVNGATDTDTVVITVNGGGGSGNQPPTANAGPDQTATDADGNGSETFSLNGLGSSDPDGTIASYVWKEGSSQRATGATPSVTLPVGRHTLTLTVTDNDGDTDTDTVVLTVNAGSSGAVSYSADIQPYFNQRCTSCHGSSGGASLRSYSNVMNGGRGGAMVVPGDSSKGTLMRKIRGGHKGAPHGTSIEQDLIDWINAGALDN
jgi:K319L-like, PKD domain/PKD domain/Planctomycete cytochrome C